MNATHTLILSHTHTEIIKLRRMHVLEVIKLTTQQMSEPDIVVHSLAFCHFVSHSICCARSLDLSIDFTKETDLQNIHFNR